MNEDKLLQALERIAVALERAAPKAEPLGFCESPRTRYIYVNREGETLWYFFDIENDKQIPIVHRALTGRITKLKSCTKEYKGKSNLKLDVHIQADKNYIIRTGLDTFFAKGLFLALNEFSVEQLQNPVTIEVSPGQDGETVVFCSVYQNGKSIRPEWNPDANWGAILDKLQFNLSINGKASHGESGGKLPSTEWEEYDYQAEDEELNYPEILPPPSPLVSYSTPRRSHPAHLTRDRLMEISLQECKRVGLTSRADGSRYLQSKYKKNTRQELSDEELLEFVGFLQSQPSAVR